MNRPQDIAQRKENVLKKLQTVPGEEKDVWVASASASGDAYLIPLSYYWDGARLTVATPKGSLNSPQPSASWGCSHSVACDPRFRGDYRGNA